MPDQKYQNESGPDLAQCFELLRQATRPNAPQVLRLLDYVIFNVLVGNHDAHAKNFSLLYSGARPVLAPGYDLLSTAVYAELQRWARIRPLAVLLYRCSRAVTRGCTQFSYRLEFALLPLMCCNRFQVYLVREKP